MASERSTRRSTSKRVPSRNGSAAAEADTSQQPTPERRFVDIDPWAMLLEQLMMVPEESNAVSEPEQRGTNDEPEPRRPAKKSRGRQAGK